MCNLFMLKFNSSSPVKLFFSCTPFVSPQWCRACLGEPCPAACLFQHLAWRKKIPHFHQSLGCGWNLVVASWLDGLQETCHEDEAYIWWPAGHPVLLMLVFSPWAILPLAFHLADVLGHPPQHWCHIPSLFLALSEIIGMDEMATSSAMPSEYPFQLLCRRGKEYCAFLANYSPPHPNCFS